MRYAADGVHWTGDLTRRPDHPARPARQRAAVGRPGLRELGVLALVYLGYAVSRVLADDTLSPAVTRAVRSSTSSASCTSTSRVASTGWFVEHEALGVAASFYYASAHYVLTLLVVVGSSADTGTSMPCPARPGRQHRRRAGRLPGDAHRTAAPDGRVRRPARRPLRRRVVGRRGLGPAGPGRAHQPAGRLPQHARGLGAVGGARGRARRGPALAHRRGLGARRGHRDRRGRHRQPLAPRRRRRVGRGAPRLVDRRSRPGAGGPCRPGAGGPCRPGAGGPSALREPAAPALREDETLSRPPAGPAPCAPAPGRSSSTSAAATP